MTNLIARIFFHLTVLALRVRAAMPQQRFEATQSLPPVQERVAHVLRHNSSAPTNSARTEPRASMWAPRTTTFSASIATVPPDILDSFVN